MNKKEAARIAKKKYGPLASAVNMSNKDRSQRFGIVLVTPGGAFDKPTLYCLGYGSNYSQAMAMTDSNPTAKAFEQQWTGAQNDLKKFYTDPVAYFEEEKKKIEDKEKEND